MGKGIVMDMNLCICMCIWVYCRVSCGLECRRDAYRRSQGWAASCS